MEDFAFDVSLINLNNIIVFSSKFESHFRRLDLVFSYLRDHCLKLKPKKCFVHETELKFQGNAISAVAIQVYMGKVEVQQNWSTPKNVTDWGNCWG